MDWSFTQEQRDIRAAIGKLLGDLVTPSSIDALEAEGGWFHRPAWEALAEAGMLGLALPESAGGAAMGAIELCLLLEQVGRHVAPIPALPTLVSAALPIAEHGTEAQRARFLPGVVRGELVLTAALTAPDSRDPLAPSVRAVADGGAWRLHGRLTNVAFATESARVLVPARLEPIFAVAVHDHGEHLTFALKPSQSV